jgi:hypothetical protein
MGVLHLHLECAAAVAAIPGGAAPDRLCPPLLERSALSMAWGMSVKSMAAVCPMGGAPCVHFCLWYSFGVSRSSQPPANTLHLAHV